MVISELADLIMKVVGYRGEITYDRNKPDGAPKKLIDLGKFNALG